MTGSTPSVITGTEPTPFGDAVRDGYGRLVLVASSVAFDPRYRTLRWILFVGFLVRLILAPLTSWGTDTPFFVWSDVRMLQTGSPYGGNTFFNPPFGPVVELPFIALLSLLQSPASFVAFVPSMMPLAVRTQMILPFVPTAGALLAQKLPLILSDTVAAGLLYHYVRTSSGPRVAGLAAAAWYLNPLVIWASAVHGEVDTIAATAVLAALLALHRRWAFSTGLLLGLGGFDKVYPFLLLPLAFAFLTLDAPRGSGWRLRAPPALRLMAGTVVSALPFLPLLPGFTVVLAHQAGNISYGGLSVLILTNPNLTSIAHYWPVGSAGKVVLVLYATLAIGAAGGVAAVVYRFYRAVPSHEERPWLALLALWSVSGSILAILSVQAENVVALLPLVLAASVTLGRVARGLYWAISLTSWAQYLSLLTPVAFFYPLWTDLGPGTVAWANAVVIPYSLGETAISQGTFWIGIGFTGGALLVALWAVVTHSVVRALRAARRSGTGQVRTPASVGTVSVRRRWSLASAPPGATAAASTLAITVLTLTGVVAVTQAVSLSRPPPIVVTLLSVDKGFYLETVKVEIHAGLSPVQVHLGLLPGVEDLRPPVVVFADTQYPGTYDTYTQTLEVAERVSLELAELGSSVALTILNGTQLTYALEAGRVGTLVVLGGIVPDSVLSATSGVLTNWVAEGGRLVWAGGPLGGGAGHPTHGPFSWDPLRFQGQQTLVRYPLSDVNGTSLFGSTPSALGSALGTEYNGTPTGANTSEVAAHGGYDLGFDTHPGANGVSPASSLIYQPEEYGGVFYFGGSFSAETRPATDVPGADFGLSTDLSVLLATGYVPAGGGSDSADLSLGALGTATLTLSVPVSSTQGGLVLLASSPAEPVPLAIWSAVLSPAVPPPLE